MPPSSSEALGSPPGSTSFESLAEPLKRWIWKQGWGALRPIQERAIPPILGSDADVVLAAATAGGKTEAAFLPLISRLVAQPDGTRGFKILYVSPLKALINDQFRRLDALCEALEIPVHRWHGDVDLAKKAKARERPDGLLLITPESLEALFVRRGLELARLFDPLGAVVIDELHAFLGTERGMQLRSLLARLEQVLGRRVRRIGLSATLGDMKLACSALRGEAAQDVVAVEVPGDGKELRMQLRGCISGKTSGERPADASSADEGGGCEDRFARHLFAQLRGTSNLAFAGSRQNVELFSDRLRRLSEAARLPNEFFPHHGNLSRGHREDLEQRLRDGRLPTTAICTSTLELGIDIGGVKSVAQIGPPRSVAALRQRLGRSGRRDGEAAVLRVYVDQRSLDDRSGPAERLRLGLVQSVAVLELLLEGWCEPPPRQALHLSTLVHQILSMLAQHGGMRAPVLHRSLCLSGPFSAAAASLFADLLRRMGSEEVRLIEQSPDGLLLLGPEGERLVEHYSFYAVFQTPEEYRVEAGGKLLGTIPILLLLRVGMTIIFAGRRWKVMEVHEEEKVVAVVPDPAGVPPMFGGDVGALHDDVVKRMRRVLMSEHMPVYLDSAARDLLQEGRRWFAKFRLGQTCRLSLEHGETLLFLWQGTAAVQTLALALSAEGVEAAVDATAPLIISCKTAEGEVATVLHRLADAPPPDGVWLASQAKNLATEKYHPYLSSELLGKDAASWRIEADRVPHLAKSLLA